MLGTYVLSAGYYDAYYLKAQQVRTLIRRDYDAGLRARRRRRDADQPDAGVQTRRARRRSAADVPGRRLHGQREPAPGCRRSACPCGFTGATRAADRPAADRPAVRRSDASAHRRRLRARYGMVEAERPDLRAAEAEPSGRRCRDEQAARGPDVRPRRLPIEGTELEQRIAQLERRARRARPDVPAALLAVRRMVHARRRARHRDPVLSRASAAREARARADARSGRRRSGVVPARFCATRPATRSTTRYQLRRRPTRRRLFGNPATPISRVLHAEAVQQELRPAPRSLVRAEPSRRRFRRNVRRVARPAVDVGDALRRLAGAAQARIHGPADARARARRGRA